MKPQGADMRRPTRREGILGIALGCLGVAVLLWVPGCDPGGRPIAGTGSGPVGGPSSFTISGDIRDEIVPGAHQPLDLSLDNPNGFGLVVDRITVTVMDVDAPQSDADHPCSAADFYVRQPAAGIAVTVRADRVDDLSGLGVARGDLPAVGLLDRPVNQDGCKGAFLTLGYEARGVEVLP